MGGWHDCFFDTWYENEGRERYAHLDEFPVVGRSTERVRALGAEIVALQADGCMEAARARLAALREAVCTLIEQMRRLSWAMRCAGQVGRARRH